MKLFRKHNSLILIFSHRYFFSNLYETREFKLNYLLIFKTLYSNANKGTFMHGGVYFLIRWFRKLFSTREFFFKYTNLKRPFNWEINLISTLRDVLNFSRDTFGVGLSQWFLNGRWRFEMKFLLVCHKLNRYGLLLANENNI